MENNNLQNSFCFNHSTPAIYDLENLVLDIAKCLIVFYSLSNFYIRCAFQYPIFFHIKSVSISLNGAETQKYSYLVFRRANVIAKY